MKYLFLVVIAVVGLAGCKSLDREACTYTDWSQLGQQDGQNGYTQTRMGQHIRACQSYGTPVDQAAWQEGYRVGLMQYCTAANAYAIGRKGQTLNAVCPAGLVPNLDLQNRRGLSYYDANRQLSRVIQRGPYFVPVRLVRDDNGNLIKTRHGIRHRPFYMLDIMRLQRERDKYDAYIPL